MYKLKQILIKGENFYYNFSFDINDFIGDGIWWLQVYDNQQCRIYDKPFATSISKLDFQQIRIIIKNEFLTYV
jgi:hypothetical protein